MRKEITFDRFVRGIMYIGGIALAIYILNRLSSVLIPFFVAWLVAYMLYPLVSFFQYKLCFKSRIISIIMAFLVVLVFLAGILSLIVPSLITEFIKFREVISEFMASNWSDSPLKNAIELFFIENVDQNLIVKLLHEKNVLDALRVGIGEAWTVVFQAVDMAIGFVASMIALLYMFFILLDYEKLSNGWLKLIPKKNRDFVETLANDVKHGMNSYFRGQALVAFLVGILFSIGFLIIDFPLAIGLGLFIGFLNLVPYLQVIGFIPTILLALLKASSTGQSFWMILLLAMLVFIVVQTIQDMILVPKIMGKLMGLNPAIILLALSVWGSLLGIIGLIIALPLTTLILSYYKQYIEWNEKLWNARQHAIPQKEQEAPDENSSE